jgi:hypothetical protein
MVQVLHLDLHIEAVRRVDSTFSSEFIIGTHKLKVASKPWERTTEIGKIPAGETGVNKPMGLSTKKSIRLGEKDDDDDDKLLRTTHTHKTKM